MPLWGGRLWLLPPWAPRTRRGVLLGGTTTHRREPVLHSVGGCPAAAAGCGLVADGSATNAALTALMSCDGD